MATNETEPTGSAVDNPSATVDTAVRKKSKQSKKDKQKTSPAATGGSNAADVDAAVERAPISSSGKLTPWRPGDYHPHVTGSGAIKLSKSGVAPLVAAARGYETVEQENAKEYAKEHNIGDGRTKAGTQFLKATSGGGDVLVMPWYTAFTAFQTNGEVHRKREASLQMRPEFPRVSPDGKIIKYEFLIGHDTVLDYHPAISRDWLSAISRTMMAEGLLKGDSSLTAQLRQYVSDRELLLVESDRDVSSARERLAALLERIPRSERVGILTMAGVGNWRKNPEWSSINLKGQDVVIAFDGDVADNWNVWNMARDLYAVLENRMKAQPSLVMVDKDERVYSAKALDPDKYKGIGLDDFFHEFGEWNDVDAMLVQEMPPAPPVPDEKRVGEWRVAADGTRVEECVQLKDDEGNKSGVEWQRRYNIGGRILATEIRRAPTDLEQSTGEFGNQVNVNSYPADCVIEVAWVDPVSEQRTTAQISGPATILGYQPQDWDRKGAKIPNSVLMHPEWPPEKGSSWLKAVKSHERENIEESTVWSTMGWVPVPESATEAFVVGEQIIANGEEAVLATKPGVTPQILTGSDKFGVNDTYKSEEFADPIERAALIKDIKAVAEHYLTDGPWKEDRIAATVLAGALRPAVPLSTITCMYFVGPPQKGKSWTAKTMMSFWQQTTMTWESSLPGSASDTFTSTEQAVARTPIWVVDDWAPSPDRRKAESDEAKVGDLIRAVHNKLGKRRSNHDMTAREVPTPQALLVITAENENSVPSIRERIVNVEFSGLRTDRMKAVDKFRTSNLAASRITGALIRMFIQRGERDGWSNLVADLEEERQTGITNAARLMIDAGIDEGDTTRPAGLVGDIALGLTAFRWLCDLVGLDDLAEKIGWAPGGYQALIAHQVALGQTGKKDMAPGKLLLHSLSDLMASGRAHVANLDAPDSPPIMSHNQSTQMNTLLGWQSSGNGEMQPKGVRIGYYTHDKASDTPVIFFNREDSFNEAQRHYSKRIPHGQSSKSSWTNVWSLGLVHPRWLEKAKSDKQFPPSNPSVQVRIGELRAYGIPVTLENLFEASDDQQSEDD